MGIYRYEIMQIEILHGLNVDVVLSPTEIFKGILTTVFVDSIISNGMNICRGLF